MIIPISIRFRPKITISNQFDSRRQLTLSLGSC